MNAAALLGIKAELGKLRHKGALTTEQFQLLKTRTKDGAATEKLLACSTKRGHCVAMARSTRASTLRTSRT